MFVCLELETDDIILWQQIDTKFAAELGLTHIVWGINREKNKAATICKLPSTLYYSEVSCTPRELSQRIQDLLREYKITYNIMTITGSNWSHHGEEYKAPQSSVPSGEVDEIESRQE